MINLVKLFCFTPFLKLIESLHLVSLVCVFDQAIYSKEREIKWKEPAKFKSCLLMMGMFHLIMLRQPLTFPHSAEKDILSILTHTQDCKNYQLTLIMQDFNDWLFFVLFLLFF